MSSSGRDCTTTPNPASHSHRIQSRSATRRHASGSRGGEPAAAGTASATEVASNITWGSAETAKKASHISGSSNSPNTPASSERAGAATTVASTRPTKKCAGNAASTAAGTSRAAQRRNTNPRPASRPRTPGPGISGSPGRPGPGPPGRARSTVPPSGSNGSAR